MIIFRYLVIIVFLILGVSVKMSNLMLLFFDCVEFFLDECKL